MKIQITSEKLFKNLVILGLLAAIIYLAIMARISTINTPTVLDYDPWWFYRYAQIIVDNNWRLPSWDVQSFYPGRPVLPFHGWAYTIAFLYKILSPFSFSLMKTAIISPLVMIALTAVAAFLVGRTLSNNMGGLITSLFVILAPSLIGTSMAGYCDTDAPVAFYFFLSLFSVLLAIKKKNVATIAFAVLANLLFVWNWGGGWLTLILFSVFMFALPIFRVLENIIHTFSLKFDFKLLMQEWIEISKPLFFIIVVSNIPSYFLLHTTLFASFFSGLTFTGLGILFRILALLALLGLCGLFGYNFFKGFSTSKSLKSKLYNILGLIFTGVLIFLTFEAAFILPEVYMLVNVSVAELQTLNIFSIEGFSAVIGRAGVLNVILSFGLLALIIFKIWKKEKIESVEIFLFLSTIFMFLLISRGVRFDLQFTIIASVAAGYMLGNYKKYPPILLVLMTFGLLFYHQLFQDATQKIAYFLLIFSVPALAWFKKDEKIIKVLILGMFLFQVLYFVSTAITLGQQSGMEISSNWYDALDWLVNNSDKETIVVTWWDPGHILTGYSYYKQKPFMVMADGAHCSPVDCLVYNHNIRIQDMGRTFATSNETEAINILKNYMGPTKEQCDELKSTFNNKIYDNPLKVDPCKNMKKMYVIASADLIGKYYWLTYFGTGTGRNFFQLPFTNQETNALVYGNGIISLVINNSQFVPVMNIPEQGIRNKIAQKVVYMQTDGQIVIQEFTNNIISGTVWAVPTFGAIGSVNQVMAPYYVIYMPPEIENSIFTNMYFYNGKELEHFKLVYQNPEVKIFEVIF
jgi:dolichyl-diphosphooligosaccharide--protein glycosyltransferase